MLKMLVRFEYLLIYETISFLFFYLGEFIENQLPEQVTIQTFMEDLLKMPSQYIEQVMYSIKAQRRRSALGATKEQKRDVPMEQQHQHQRARSAITSTTQSTASASNDS